MKTTDITLSPYKIYWVEVRAIKGIVTKKDEKILCGYNHCGRSSKNLLLHFGSKERAEKFLDGDFSKLTKQYEARLCTDKQISLSYRDSDISIIAIPFTKKQNEAMTIIGPSLK